MSILAFDIETTGVSWEEVAPALQESLTRNIRKNSVSEEEFIAKMEEMKSNLVFSPLTGRIVSLAFYDILGQRGGVYFQAPNGSVADFEEDGMVYRVMDEKGILEAFSRILEHVDTVVTFNGHSFDNPYVMLRAALHGVKLSKNLAVNKFLGSQKYDGIKHVDLFEQFTFYGALSRKGMGLDGLSSAFGLKSPKEEGVSGEMVGPLFEAGEYLKIAKYNGADARATGELYKIWEKYLRN